MTGVKEGALAWGQEICIYFMYLVANDVVENNLKYFEGEKESNAVKKKMPLTLLFTGQQIR